MEDDEIDPLQTPLLDPAEKDEEVAAAAAVVEEAEMAESISGRSHDLFRHHRRNLCRQMRNSSQYRRSFVSGMA